MDDCDVNGVTTPTMVRLAASRVKRPSESGPCSGPVEVVEGALVLRSRVLVLYTGGTIGMKARNGVCCVCSVYVPEPRFLVKELQGMPLFHDHQYASRCGMEPDDELVLPLTKDNKRVVYHVKEYETLIDSSNMNYDDYVKMSSDVQESYTKYDGFVILHGTDTMAYTASALSFMLENLGKPVILTGSQIPIFELRSDGRSNFIGALILAGTYNIPEVSIFFNNALLRGNRSSKVDTGAFDAFESPNMEPLAKVEIHIKVNQEAIFRHRGLKKFAVNTNMCPDVGILRLFPSITNNTVKAFLQPPMKGVVLQTYGEGNGPTARLDLMRTLREATEGGLIIVNTSQCPRGSVSPAYAAGKDLEDVGVIPGYDMTMEASLMKLSFVLGQDQLSVEEKKTLMSQNLRGEMSVANKDDGKQIHFSLIEKLAEAIVLTSSEETRLLREVVFPYLLCAAARDDSIDALNKLQDAGAVFSMCDYDGRTALHIACSEGHSDVICHLLDGGASVHARDRYGDTPLDNAVMFERIDVIPLLRATGAHLASTPGGKQASTICSAVVADSLTALDAWRLAGADFNVTNYDGRTPLHIAASLGLENKVRFLLEHGASPAAVDLHGKTPSDEARERGFTAILSLLESFESTNGVEMTVADRIGLKKDKAGIEKERMMKSGDELRNGGEALVDGGDKVINDKEVLLNGAAGLGNEKEEIKNGGPELSNGGPELWNREPGLRNGGPELRNGEPEFDAES